MDISTEEANGKARDERDRALREEILAALGKVISGISHDLRSPLGVMKNAVFYLKTNLRESDKKLIRHLELIEKQLTRSTDMIEDVQAFFRPAPLSPRKGDMNELLREALERVSIPGSVEIERDLDGDLPEVEADAVQIRRVFANIIRNAAGAMPQGGVLRIATAPADEYVEITIRDTGTGISGEDLPRIFEPLFTTREKGAGLGLAVVRDTVGRHGGDVDVESEPGEGSCFTVRLPLKMAGHKPQPNMGDTHA